MISKNGKNSTACFVFSSSTKNLQTVYELENTFEIVAKSSFLDSYKIYEWFPPESIKVCNE